MSVALVVIYNHRFDRNIDVVESIYSKRFSSIFHLVPFYDGPKKNVIAVYENSFYFQGYVAQGYKGFEGDHEHYFFIADDMILNPAIDEGNYREVFDLDERSGFLPELDSMPGGKWPHDRAAANFDPFRRGVEIKAEIPSAGEAAKVLEALGVKNGPYRLKETYFCDDNFRPRNVLRQALKLAYDRFILGTRHDRPKYPLARSYSDIFIVSAKSMPKFVSYCGAFAATDLWVEVAIPTALALAGERIKVQSQLRLQGRPLWSAEDLSLLDRYQHNLNALLADFPETYIYLHPVKLSKWKFDA